MAWRILNLFRKPLPNGIAKTDVEKYIPFGAGDCWPLNWAETIENSPSAASCLSTLQDFMEGFGFSDTDLEKRVANSQGETFWQIHQKTVASYSQFKGFYWLLRFNGGGQVTEWMVLDFENCRLGKPDDVGYIAHILYNPFFGTADYKGIDKKLTKCYDVWSPAGLQDQILDQGSQFKGQVFYFGTTSPLSRYYPKPEAVSAAKWMKTEAGVSDYHEDNINNGFLQPFMLAMIGDPNQPSTNPDFQDTNDGKPATVADEFDQVIAENFMGAKRVGNMWVNWYSSKDEVPIPIAMPTNNNGDLFITLDNQATKKITIAFKVPSILANINEGVSLGGDGNMVRVAVKLMQQRVIKDQRHLTDAYQTILKLMATPYVQDVVIVPYNPYPELEVIDDKIWRAMTREEQRKWIQENTEIELFAEDLAEPVTEPLTQPLQISNAVPIQFPDKVVNSIKKTKEYIVKMGRICPGKWGKDLSDKVLANNNIGMREMKRLYDYLKKNEANANRPYNEGCEVLQYHQLGGKDMQDFLEEELKRLDQWLN